MAGFHVPWTEILEFFILLSTLIFCLVLDTVEITVKKSVSERKSRGHRTSKIVKSKQSYMYTMAICPIIVRACVLDAWRGMWICVHIMIVRMRSNIGCERPWGHPFDEAGFLLPLGNRINRVPLYFVNLERGGCAPGDNIYLVCSMPWGITLGVKGPHVSPRVLWCVGSGLNFGK